MNYDNHDLIWHCPHCGKQNQEPMHSDPQAHFISITCEHCGEETEGCLCDTGVIIDLDKMQSRLASLAGKKSAKARKNLGHNSEHYRNLAKKRWKK